MIKAEELRIGNLINDRSTGVEEVFSVIFNDVNGWDLKQFDFIPLTEEWLLKCGDKCKLTEQWSYSVPIGALKLYLRPAMGKWYSQFNDIYLGDRIEHVHTLQNFKYALTGSELTFKP